MRNIAEIMKYFKSLLINLIIILKENNITTIKKYPNGVSYDIKILKYTNSKYYSS